VTNTSSTEVSDRSGTHRSERAIRVGSLAFLGMVLVAGGLGLLGVRSASAVATLNGYTLEVTHAITTRPGLATPFELRVATDDGAPLPREVTIRVESAYLAMFDENRFHPEPVSSFRTDRWTWWTFEVPDGAQEMSVGLDARLEPSVQSGRSSTAALEIAGEEKVAVHFVTGVMP
jgi:hypothetical protein